MRHSIIITSFLMLFCTSACDKGEVIATYRGGSITMEDFNKELQNLPPNLRARYSTAQGKKEFLEQLLQRRLLVEKARADGLDRDPDIVRQVEDFRTNLLRNKLLQEVTSRKTDITEEEVRNYYNTHEEEFTQPERICLNVIQFKDSKTAESLLKGLRSKKLSFAEVVKKHSTDPLTRARNGDLGCLIKGGRPDIPPEVFNLPQGAISDIVKRNDSSSIYQVREVMPPQKVEFEKVSMSIRQRLINIKRKERFDNFMKELKEKADVKIYHELIETKTEEPAEDR